MLTKRELDYVVIVGEEELKKSIFKLKEMSSGAEVSI